MKRTTTRLCAMCDRVIPDTFIVCHEHFADYKQYKDEEWFRELVMAQRRQFEIDNMESLLGVIHTKTYQRLTDSEKQAIKFLRFKKLGPKSISKLLGINVETIKKYIYHRSNGKQ